jgi:hypothetical protein
LQSLGLLALALALAFAQAAAGSGADTAVRVGQADKGSIQLPQLGVLRVTGVSATGARIEIGVVTNSNSATVRFELRRVGTTTFSAAGSVVLAGAAQGEFAGVQVTNLACGRSYEFRATAQNAAGTVGPSIAFAFATAACPAGTLSVVLEAVGTAPAGVGVALRTDVAGMTGTGRYDWDVDGDGVVDRTGSQSALDIIYAGDYAGSVAVTVAGAGGMQGRGVVSVDVRVPHLVATASAAASQVCGDGDALPEPGERWQLPLRIANQGSVAARGGFVSLLPGDRVQAAENGQAIAGALVLDPPTLDTGALAPGASVDRVLAVQIKTSAGCGSSFPIVQGAGGDAYSSDGDERTLATLVTPAAGQCQVFSGCTAPKAAIVPRQGLYYVPTKPGNGISSLLTRTAAGDTVYFGAWFTADVGNRPTWYIVQGNLVDNQVVGAPIYKLTRNPGPGFAVTLATVGRASVTLVDAERIVFKYKIPDNSLAGFAIKAESMQYLFAGGANTTPNRTGAWYNAGESGWGQVVSQFAGAGGANSTFIVQYVFDGANQPTWVAAVESTADLAAGRPFQSFKVNCPGCPWTAGYESETKAAGTASLIFNDARNARISTNLILRDDSTWQRSNLPITLLTDPQ